MRPHVELIHEGDYVWRRAELPGGVGEAVQRNLSVDEETGAASLRIDFRSGFRRPAGRHAADTEWFVIEGEVAVGERTLRAGGYLQAPGGTKIPEVRAAAGTRVLLFREGDWGFEAAGPDDGRVALTVVDSAAAGWRQVATAGPPAGLMIKALRKDPETGLTSRLVWAKPGWADERLEHHDVFEEAYTLSGRATYNFGEMTPGTYFFRPPGVKHGRFVSAEPDGCVWLIRSGGDIVNLYTLDSEVVVRGRPLNYDPATQGPEIAGLPVRSRTTGAWDGMGR
jgi:quercetin dioxygenase-like cupin family protein